jgi:5-methylcytosine-specific restriction protein A
MWSAANTSRCAPACDRAAVLARFQDQKAKSVMPIKPKHPCNRPGCPALTYERLCPDHKREHNRRFDATRGTTKQRGYAGTWPARRKRWLALHSLCETCEANGLVVAATEVDHVIPLAQGGADDESNYSSKCHPCHSRKTAKEVGWSQ